MLSTLLTLSTQFTLTNSNILALLLSEELCNWSILHFVYLFVFLCTSQLLSLNDHCSIVSTKWHDKCQSVRVLFPSKNTSSRFVASRFNSRPCRFAAFRSRVFTKTYRQLHQGGVPLTNHRPVQGCRPNGPIRTLTARISTRQAASMICPSPYHDILGHDFLFKEHDILTSLSERVRNHFWPKIIF